jgi:hypothetical protein
MIKIILFLSIIFLFINCRNRAEDKDSPDIKNSSNNKFIVDTTIVKYFPITLEGLQAKFQYHLQVKTWNDPVYWEITITNNSKILLSKTSLDSIINRFFNDSNYIGYCNNYIDCKKKWYYKDIMKIYYDTLRRNDEQKDYFKEISFNITEDFYKNYSINVNKPKNIVTSFWKEYSDKDFLTFGFKFAPEGDKTPSLAFYPKQNILIPIYSSK